MDIPSEEKKSLCDALLAACDDCMGMAMTYVLSSTLATLLTEIQEKLLTRSKVESVSTIRK